jgi:hypothetical protein
MRWKEWLEKFRCLSSQSPQAGPDALRQPGCERAGVALPLALCEPGHPLIFWLNLVQPQQWLKSHWARNVTSKPFCKG